MATPFPGMDPYLEHPTLWTGVHAGLISAIRHQIGPKLRSRYVASVEERVMIDIPQQQRVPDLWIQKTRHGGDRSASFAESSAAMLEEPLVLEVPSDPVREYFVEILDRYQDMKVVTVIEVLSPINKATGPGRGEYLRKRTTTLQSSTHLVEIDLLRRGTRLPEFSEEQLEGLGPFDYLITVNRFQPGRNQYEVIPRQLRSPLPNFGIPLVAPDPDVGLDLQVALDQVYEDGSYMLRIHYERPCSPSLPDDAQAWLNDRWKHDQQHSELFGTAE